MTPGFSTRTGLFSRTFPPQGAQHLLLHLAQHPLLAGKARDLAPVEEPGRPAVLLRPRFASLEYRDGGAPLFEILDRAGYDVKWGSDDPELRARRKGKMFAARREREAPGTIRPAGSDG